MKTSAKHFGLAAGP